MILSEPASSSFSAAIGAVPSASPCKNYATNDGFTGSPQSSAIASFYNPSTTIGNPVTGYLSPLSAAVAVGPGAVATSFTATAVSNQTAIGSVSNAVSSAGFSPLLPPSYPRPYVSDTFSKCNGLSSLYGMGQYPTPLPHLGNSLVTKVETSAAVDAKINYTMPPSNDTKTQLKISAALSTDSSSTCSSAASSPKQPYLTTSSRTKIPPKKRPLPVPEDSKDQQYWEKRKKNNDSAKRSRDLRRQKEEQTRINALLLQEENKRSRTEIEYLRKEIESLKYMLFHAT